SPCTLQPAVALILERTDVFCIAIKEAIVGRRLSVRCQDRGGKWLRILGIDASYKLRIGCCVSEGRGLEESDLIEAVIIIEIRRVRIGLRRIFRDCNVRLVVEEDGATQLSRRWNVARFIHAREPIRRDDVVDVERSVVAKDETISIRRRYIAT